MDPKTLIPSPDAIALGWTWFKALLIPCFAIHLLFMNALLGSSIIGCVHTLRSKGDGPHITRAISQKLPFYMSFTINFGVAALLFMQVLYGHLFYTSSILMAVWWLSALAVVLSAYVAVYRLDFRFDAMGRPMRTAIFAIIALCLLWVGFVFVNNFTMMVDPASWIRYFDKPAGLLWHWNDPTLIPRYLHFVTASLAVGGLVMAVLSPSPEKKRIGLQWFTAATAAQFIIGGWFFMALPQNIRLSLMGGNQWAGACFAISLLGVLVALFFGIRQMRWPAMWATGVTIIGMVLVRDAVRTLYLAPYFAVEKLTVRIQYTPMVMFALFVVLGIAAVEYMIKLWQGAKVQ